MDIGGIEDDTCDILLTSEDSVGVQGGLLLNFDPRAVTDGVANNEKAIKEVMGNNVTLYNFDYNQESGFYDGCLWLDGVNDYITVECGTDEDKQELIENGFTVEITGNIETGISYKKTNGIYNNVGNCSLGGICFYGNHNSEQYSDFRFYLDDRYDGTLLWTINGASRKQKAPSDYSFHNAVHNIAYPFRVSKIEEEVSNFVITLNPKIIKECDNEEGKLDDGSTFVKTGKYIKASLWSKGELILSSDVAIAQWETFTTNTINDCNEFVIGFYYTNANFGTGPCFTKMKLKSLRVYNRALRENEIAKNWLTDETYEKIINHGI